MKSVAAAAEVVRVRLPSFPVMRKIAKAQGIGCVVGTVEGLMPGGGGSIASFFSYNEAKRWSRYREEFGKGSRSEEHTSELQLRQYLVCRLLLEKKKTIDIAYACPHDFATLHLHDYPVFPSPLYSPLPHFPPNPHPYPHHHPLRDCVPHH